MQACGDCRGDTCANKEITVEEDLVEEEEESNQATDGNIFEKLLSF